MNKPLPATAQITVKVVIELPDGTVCRGYLRLDNDDNQRPIEFQSAGLACQAGVYEVLRAVWPQAPTGGPHERLDSPH